MKIAYVIAASQYIQLKLAFMAGSASSVQKVVRFSSLKNSTGKYDCDSGKCQPILRFHRSVHGHVFPHDQTCEEKETCE